MKPFSLKGQIHFQSAETLQNSKCFFWRLSTFAREMRSSLLSDGLQKNEFHKAWRRGLEIINYFGAVLKSHGRYMHHFSLMEITLAQIQALRMLFQFCLFFCFRFLLIMGFL